MGPDQTGPSNPCGLVFDPQEGTLEKVQGSTLNTALIQGSEVEWSEPTEGRRGTRWGWSQPTGASSWTFQWGRSQHLGRIPVVRSTTVSSFLRNPDLSSASFHIPLTMQ